MFVLCTAAIFYQKPISSAVIKSKQQTPPASTQPSQHPAPSIPRVVPYSTARMAKLLPTSSSRGTRVYQQQHIMTTTMCPMKHGQKERLKKARHLIPLVGTNLIAEAATVAAKVHLSHDKGPSANTSLSTAVELILRGFEIRAHSISHEKRGLCRHRTEPPTTSKGKAFRVLAMYATFTTFRAVVKGKRHAGSNTLREFYYTIHGTTSPANSSSVMSPLLLALVAALLFPALDALAEKATALSHGCLQDSLQGGAAAQSAHYRQEEQKISLHIDTRQTQQ